MRISLSRTPLTIKPGWVKYTFLRPTEFYIEQVQFFPESAASFSLSELKEIVKEMEKMHDIRPR
jgi:hypothetical protein